MRRDEATALGDLAGDGARGVANRAEELHRAIAGRVFGRLGAAAEPVRVTHDAIATAIYAGVRGATAAGAHAAGVAVGATRPGDARSVADGPRATAFAVGALNGILGDRLAATGNALALSMAVRADGEDLPLTPERLAEAFPAAGPRVAVLLHGLCETDTSWSIGTRREGLPPLPTYAERLEDDLGLTSLVVRYNTGRRISDNGRDLDVLLQGIVDAWPCEVRELVLVGHSMGGLVIRSGCHAGEASGNAWTNRLTHVVMLGTPHLGAPLEQTVNRATRLMRRVPEAVPVAQVLDVRSVGIRDLRFGAITDEDWDGHTADHTDDPCGDIPLPPGVRHCTISATIASRHDSPAGRLLGDLLVYHSSATGAGRRRKIAFTVEDTIHMGGLNHFALLNHPRVYAQLRDWLAEPWRREPRALLTAG